MRRVERLQERKRQLGLAVVAAELLLRPSSTDAEVVAAVDYFRSLPLPADAADTVVGGGDDEGEAGRKRAT